MCSSATTCSSPAAARAQRPGDHPEPLTTLATIATLSDRLRVGTIVSNIGFLHPVLVLRQFANLASLFGGERVLAGLGAGWNREEFAAIDLAMPPCRARMDRLEEAAHLARDLFDRGMASLDGAAGACARARSVLCWWYADAPRRPAAARRRSRAIATLRRRAPRMLRNGQGSVPKVFPRGREDVTRRNTRSREIEMGTGGKLGGPIYNKHHHHLFHPVLVVLLLMWHEDWC